MRIIISKSIFIASSISVLQLPDVQRDLMKCIFHLVHIISTSFCIESENDKESIYVESGHVDINPEIGYIEDFLLSLTTQQWKVSTLMT